MIADVVTSDASTISREMVSVMKDFVKVIKDLQKDMGGQVRMSLRHAMTRTHAREHVVTCKTSCHQRQPVID